MREATRVSELRESLREARPDGRSVGLVPTMGFLHEGHLRLVEHAREENDLVVLSIFVNPTQFGPTEDFSRYPRDVDQDRQMASANGVDVLFIPEMGEVYPNGPENQQIWVDPGLLGWAPEGSSRPGHFRGVATVVAKLFNMAEPDRAYFGQKDAQQALMVARMVKDLAFPIEIRVVPTVRESDGLALSSRNAYLSPEERRQAAALWLALECGRSLLVGNERNSSLIEAAMRELIQESAPLASLDYVSIAALETLAPVSGEITGDSLVAVAASFGSTRLIDNVIVRFVEGEVCIT